MRRTGEGLIVLNEAPGSLKRTETGGWGRGPIQVRYDTDLVPFERRLEPGDSFASAKASVAFFVEGRGWADPRWVMPTYTSNVIKRTGTAWQPLWMYNSWQPFQHEIDLKTMTESAGGAARIGLDIFDDPVRCLAKPYREIAAKRLSDLIATNDLRFVQIDLTTNFDSYGGEMGCWAEGHDHHTWAESLVRGYEGISYVLDRTYQDHPGVVLDLTFECWGNYKHGIDYAHIALADPDCLSNVNDSSEESVGPRQARMLLYERALAIPTENLDIGNLLVNARPIEERFATAIGASPLLNGDLRELTRGQQDWWAQKIRWYKALRTKVSLNEGFFPLGDWRQPNVVTWDGFARLSRKGEGIMVIFKNESEVEAVELKIPAFPDGAYAMRSEMTQQTVGRYTGTQIRKGVRVKLPQNNKVEILEIRSQ